MHFVLSEFNSYPSSHFSQIVDSGHFLQFGIDLHFLASIKINDSSKANNNILNFLYFPNKEIKINSFIFYNLFFFQNYFF